MNIGIVVYHHRHGVDVFPVIMNTRKPPNITDAFMKAIGVDGTELDVDIDESAELISFWNVDKLPTVGSDTGKGVFDWMPSE